MGTMTIDGRKVEFTDERNVLTVIRKAGINIPTLCYHSEVSTFGACRLCTVEDDRGRTFASCSEEPRDGMVIYTNSGKIKKYRKLVVELLLAAHCRDCTTCVKSGECVLQELAHRLGVHNIRFQNTREHYEIDDSSPSLIRDPNKCILCGDCVRACEELQGIGALNFAYRGTEAIVIPAFNKKIAETQCVNCGQCRVFCPTGAISIKTHMDEVWDALADPDVRVVAQIAPAVRVAVGDHYGLTKGRSVMGKIVNALHRMGFDEIYDTSFSADLTIMEESAEFLKRVENGENLPLLTSCCPAWVKFITDQYKDYIPNLSTCRSPQGMMSAVIKEYFRDPENAKGKRTVMVSVMPCTAKKAEAIRPNSFTDGEQDTDIVITTTELIRMIDNFGLDFDVLFGPAYKGIPLSVATTMAISDLYGKDIRYCSNRKEVKDHGDTGILLGSKIKDGDRVMIIEDVTTSGKSIEETFPIIKAQGDVEIKGLIVSLNRMERGKGTKSALDEIKDLYGFPTAAIVTMADVTECLYNKECNGQVVIDDKIKAALDAYYEQYGAKNE